MLSVVCLSLARHMMPCDPQIRFIRMAYWLMRMRARCNENIQQLESHSTCVRVLRTCKRKDACFGDCISIIFYFYLFYF